MGDGVMGGGWKGGVAADEQLMRMPSGRHTDRQTGWGRAAVVRCGAYWAGGRHDWRRRSRSGRAEGRSEREGVTCGKGVRVEVVVVVVEVVLVVVSRLSSSGPWAELHRAR